MAKTFATMKTDVGNMLMDKSTSMATLIGGWLNDKYRDISHRMLWSALIDNAHTITVTANTATYSLESDFDEEIACVDITNGVPLKRYTEGTWWLERGPEYSGTTLQTGQPTRYLILREQGKLSLDPTPNANLTLAFPYKKLITELSTDAATVAIKDIESIMEFGADSEGMSYKRQFQKATYYLQKFELELSQRIGRERSMINQVYQMTPQSREMNPYGRLTGDLSYDSI